MMPLLLADAELVRAHAAAVAAVLAFRRIVGDRADAAKAAADANPRSVHAEDQWLIAAGVACAADRIAVPTLAQLGLRAPSRLSDDAITAENAL